MLITDENTIALNDSNKIVLLEDPYKVEDVKLLRIAKLIALKESEEDPDKWMLRSNLDEDLLCCILCGIYREWTRIEFKKSYLILWEEDDKRIIDVNEYKDNPIISSMLEIKELDFSYLRPYYKV